MAKLIEIRVVQWTAWLDARDAPQSDSIVLCDGKTGVEALDDEVLVNLDVQSLGIPNSTSPQAQHKRVLYAFEASLARDITGDEATERIAASKKADKDTEKAPSGKLATPSLVVPSPGSRVN